MAKPAYRTHYEKVKQRQRIEKLLVGCEANGFGFPCWGIICWGHIITRQYRPLKNHPKNRVWLCKTHERYFNRQGLSFWYTFVKANFPDRFAYVMERYHNEAV
jgi:hypothetical protein